MTAAATRKILGKFTAFGRLGPFIEQREADIGPDQDDQDEGTPQKWHVFSPSGPIIPQGSEKKKFARLCKPFQAICLTILRMASVKARFCNVARSIEESTTPI